MRRDDPSNPKYSHIQEEKPYFPGRKGGGYNK